MGFGIQAPQLFTPSFPSGMPSDTGLSLPWSPWGYGQMAQNDSKVRGSEASTGPKPEGVLGRWARVWGDRVQLTGPSGQLSLCPEVAHHRLGGGQS